MRKGIGIQLYVPDRAYGFLAKQRLITSILLILHLSITLIKMLGATPINIGTILSRRPFAHPTWFVVLHQGFVVDDVYEEFTDVVVALVAASPASSLASASTVK
jgi:energy-converting hydrogenase Eha subunit C